MEDINENITQCNLCSHGRFLQARSHLLNCIDISYSVILSLMFLSRDFLSRETL